MSKKSSKKPVDFDHALGIQLRKLREEANIRQDDLAVTARQKWGLDWTRATVAKIEKGERRLTALEFLLLRPLMGMDYDRFFPDGPQIALSAHCAVRPQALRQLLEGGNLHPDIEQSRTFIIPNPAERKLSAASLYMAVEASSKMEAERKVAAKLGLKVSTFVTLAYQLWGRSLSEERDFRATEAAKTLSGRTVQALRGHLTRELIKEFRANVKERKARD